MKININLSGGLGNQMFQFAFGLYLKVMYQGDLFFNHRNDGLRKYMLDIFDLQETISPSFDCDKINYYGSFHNDPMFPYNNLDGDKNYCVDGFFQNEKYFLSVSEKIKKIFSQQNKFYLDEFTLVVQVRRTDFLQNSDFFVCDLNWYYQAISMFENIYKIIIVSDDLNWCKNNFKNLPDKEFEFLDLNEKDTLCLLQHSKNVIISNSSFAWWGVWLGTPIKVIQPKIWYKKDLSWDLGCKNWIRL